MSQQNQTSAATCSEENSAALTREDYQALWNLADQQVKAAQRDAAGLSGSELDCANNTILRWARRADKLAAYINGRRPS